MKWFKKLTAKVKDEVDWKAEALKLNAEVNRLHASLNPLDEINIRLIQQLRQMDQWAFNISQVAPDWKRIQPIFAAMMQQVDKRMQAENGRIRNLMVGEIKQAYNEPPKLSKQEQLKIEARNKWDPK